MHNFVVPVNLVLGSDWGTGIQGKYLNTLTFKEEMPFTPFQAGFLSLKKEEVFGLFI